MTAPSADELHDAFAGKSVLVTGHTGFKGAWLVIWLAHLGARVTGLALRPPTTPSVFDDVRLAERCTDLDGDVRDLAAVRSAIASSSPDVIFHLAAQAIVHEGYRDPIGTFGTNVAGTVNVIEAVRRAARRCAVVVVTSDKCYAIDGEMAPRREDDRLGGSDPYSASKAAAEIAVAAMRRSYFPPERLAEHAVAVATARAGNVIGGGDFAADRIVPDAVRALQEGRPVLVRNPGHVRPWQHVLEPLSGYLLLAMRLMGHQGAKYCEAWNFGPTRGSERTVGELVDAIIREWGAGSWERVDRPARPYETPVLRLDASKAASRLEWHPRWDLGTAIARAIEWYRARRETDAQWLRALSERHIVEYMTVR